MTQTPKEVTMNLLFVTGTILVICCIYIMVIQEMKIKSLNGEFDNITIMLSNIEHYYEDKNVHCYKDYKIHNSNKVYRCTEHHYNTSSWGNCSLLK